MAPGKVRDTDILTIWNKMNWKAQGLKLLVEIKFRAGLTVRISKGKLILAKSGNRITPLNIKDS
jgi:hypothetical protein